MVFLQSNPADIEDSDLEPAVDPKPRVKETVPKAGYGPCSICGCGGFAGSGTSIDYCQRGSCGHHFNDHG